MSASLFSSSWYRVAELKPRLRPHAQISPADVSRTALVRAAGPSDRPVLSGVARRQSDVVPDGRPAHVARGLGHRRRAFGRRPTDPGRHHPAGLTAARRGSPAGRVAPRRCRDRRALAARRAAPAHSAAAQSDVDAPAAVRSRQAARRNLAAGAAIVQHGRPAGLVGPGADRRHIGGAALVGAHLQCRRSRAGGAERRLDRVRLSADEDPARARPRLCHQDVGRRGARGRRHAAGVHPGSLCGCIRVGSVPAEAASNSWSAPPASSSSWRSRRSP